MITPTENEFKPVETGSSNRENLIPLDQSNIVDDLDIRADFENFLDTTIDSPNP